MAKKKDPAAVALGKRRWRGTTKAQRRKAMSELASSLSPEAATARAVKAWETKRKKAAKPAVSST